MSDSRGQRRDFEPLERRRMEGRRLFRKGVPQAQIARQLKAARQTVSRWVRQYRESGREALRQAGRAVERDGKAIEQWKRRCRPAMCRPLKYPNAITKVRPSDSKHAALQNWAYFSGLSKSRVEGRTVVFLDDSGISQRPQRGRTRAPRGQTPVLLYCFHWKTLSAVAGVTFRNFSFQLHPGPIRTPQAVELLDALKRQVRGPLLGIWDRLRTAARCNGATWRPAGPGGGRVPAGLCPGVESARIALGPLEAA